MNHVLNNIRPRNKIVVDLLATDYLNAFHVKSKNIRLIVNTVSKSVYHQIKGLVANHKYIIKDANFLYAEIINTKDNANYISEHYSIYWTSEDCILLDKFYAMIHNKIHNEFIRSFLISVMIEIMVQQSVFGRFNVTTEDYISGKENLSKDQFLFIVEDMKNKINSGPNITVISTGMVDLIGTISTAGIIYCEAPNRNIFYDYHPIFDVFENYGKGKFKPNRLHISEDIQTKAEHYVYRGDKFIKYWAELWPSILYIDFEYFVFKANKKMSVEKEWLHDKLTPHGSVWKLKDDYIILQKKYNFF